METKILQSQKYKISDEILLKRASSQIPDFKETEHVKELYKLLSEYINQDENFEKRVLKTQKGDIKFSLGKGIFIVSSPGAGKSFLFEDLICEFIKYRKLTAYQIQSLYLEHGFDAVKKYNESIYTRSTESKTVYDLYIDDLGREMQSIKFFGTDINFMDVFFDSRYRLYKKAGAITHASTNKQLGELKSYYSPQTFSRMFEMFNFVVLTNTVDFRLNF